jgi:hypothetical protein
LLNVQLARLRMFGALSPRIHLDIPVILASDSGHKLPPAGIVKTA